MRIVIIGGGIAGLSAAHRLRSAAPHLDVRLLEATSRLGGRIGTDRIDRFVVEEGPDSFLSSKPRGVGLVEDLGMTDRLQGTRTETRGSFVLRGGRLHPMPEGLTGLVPSRLEPLLESDLFSSDGKARLQEEEQIPAMPPTGDETLAAFVKRRFGREVYERLIEPLMSGIYAGNGEELSVAATFPQLRRLELEHGSVIKGIQASQLAPSQPGVRPGFVTPIGGMAEIVDALAAELGPMMRTGTRARSLRRQRDVWSLELESGEQVQSQSAILALPAHSAAALLSEIAPAAAGALSRIPYVSTATVALAYKTADLPRVPVGHGYVIPRAEGRAALACTFVSQKWAHRAPPNSSLFRVFIGRAGDPDATALSGDALLEIARRELLETLDITAEPILHRVARHPQAMPQYTLGHLDRLETIDRDLANHAGLYLAGALRGVGIPDCVASGETAADRAAGFIRQHSRTHA